jgi:CheY-like chemotaxis protein
MRPELLDLRDIAVNIIKVLKRLSGETIALEFTPPPEIPLVYGDPGMIEQVLMNLAANAREAMPAAGKITLSVQPLAVDEAHPRTHPEARAGAFVCLRVSDAGCGMDAATLSRIFEPFFTTKQARKAPGLGLATVYGIVKQHEGWVEVDSEVGKGTTFSVFFPATGKKAGSGKMDEPSPAQVRGGSEAILLVEDDAAVLKMGRIILQDCGYRVLEAASGAEALEVWQRNPDAIDLLLTDLVMPQGLSGIELAQRLLAQKPGLKIIFTSGYNVSDMDTDFVSEGGGAFLQKPYTRSTLAQAVRESLDK